MRIFVTDTGHGIEKERQTELFQPFNRIGRENSEIEGTGIGLSITKRLVEAMGGEMGFESVQNQDSTFWVEFPENETRFEPDATESRETTEYEISEDENRRESILYMEQSG